MRRSGFTLIELMLVLAIIGVATSLVLTSFSAFQRSGDLHRTAAGVVRLFRVISSETIQSRRPYKVTADAGGLTGHASVVKTGGSCAATFDGATEVVMPPPGTTIRALPASGPWVVDTGGALFRAGEGGTALPTAATALIARISNAAGCVQVGLDPVTGVTVGDCEDAP